MWLEVVFILGADSAIDPVTGNDQIMRAEILFALDMGIELKVDAKAPRSLRGSAAKARCRCRCPSRI